jgi:hypothetical protein
MWDWRRSRNLVFWEYARMRARPAGPAQSSVFHYFARRGPTKEAHRRALDRPDGVRHSGAGRGHARCLPVTPPRGASDQRKRPEAGSHRYAVACVPIMVEIMVAIVVSDRMTQWHSRNCSSRRHRVAQIAAAIADDGEVRGPKSASARPGPCTRPRSADALTRREIPPGPKAPGVKLVRPRPPAPTSWGRPRALRAACGRSSLTPGRAGWSRRHGSGVPPSAQRPRRARALPRSGPATRR